MHLQTSSQRKHSVSLQALHPSNWIWSVNGKLQYRKHPGHYCAKKLHIGIWHFLIENKRNLQNYTIRSLDFARMFWILTKLWTLSFRMDTSTSKAVSHSNNLEERKKCKLVYKWRNLSWILWCWLGYNFGSDVANDLLPKDVKTEKAWQTTFS